ncbi:mucin-5AC-like [Oreochromis aureus]|nr:mucin-5AC-like [Oreochromis aureus]
MRLTALCVCGTLLAFSSLSWITADSDEGILLVDKGFGPCTVTLTPGGPCRQVQHESTCPYLLTLPPLRIHLPQQLKELEKIVEDLQKLKDSVDELREICADCTVSQTERECGRQRENERETLSEGTDRREDERNWVNERLQENGFKQECSTVSVMEGDGHLEKTGTQEEKERKKWETERESNGGLIKENEEGETLTEVLETDGTTQSDRGKGKDKVVPTKVNTGGVNEGTVGEKVADKNNRQGERDRNKDTAGEENSKGYQENILEHGKERKTFTNVNKTEESGHHVWQDKTEEIETQTEASDRIKMSENHDENTNQEQEQSREEKKKEMEKRVKVEQNNEERKQTESIRRTEKEKTIKEGGEGRETGKEIKTEDEETESGEGDVDRELPSSKATKRTDFVSISPTPHSTINIALGLDSVDSNEATSSIPSPPLPSSTLHYITDVSHEITTQNTGLVAAGISKPPKPDAKTHTETTMSTVSGQHITNQTTTSRPGLHSHISSTTTTTVSRAHHQDLTVGAKKNMSSNTKIGAKPLPGQGPKPGKRPKYNQKKHPFHHKPRIDQRPKPKPGKDPKGVETSKPKQIIPPHILPTDQNLNNNSIPKHGQNYTPDQNKLPIQKSKPNEKTVTPIWTPPPHHRPQNENTTKSDEYPGIDQEHESDHIPATNQTETEPQMSYSNQGSTLRNKTRPDLTKTAPNQKPKITQIIPTKPKPVQEPESKESPTASYTEKPKQKETSDENPSQVSNSNQDSTPRKKTIPDLTKTPANKKPKTRQNIPTKPKPFQDRDSKESSTASYAEKAEQNEKSDENPSQVPYSNQDPLTGKTTIPDLLKTPPNQKPKITQIIPTKPKPVQEHESKESPTASYTEKPNQKQTSDENPLHVSNSNQDSTPRNKTTPDLMKTPPKEKPKTRQNIPTKPKPVQEHESKGSSTAGYAEKAKQNETSDENLSQVPYSNQELSSGKKTIPDLMKTPPNQEPKISQIIPTKPKLAQEPESKESPTASYTEKPKQKETIDENPSYVSNSNQDSTPRNKTIPDLTNTPPEENPKTRQHVPTEPKPVQEHESKVSPTASYAEKGKQNETSDENPSQVPYSNQAPSSGKTILDLTKTPPNQKPKTSQIIPTKPKPFQEPESKGSSTAGYAEKPKQNEKSDENPQQVSFSNQDPTSGKKTIPVLTKTPPNQKPKISQIIPTKHKPVQDPKAKGSPTASYTEKPKQKQTSGENPSQVSNSNQDSTPRNKTTPDLLKTPPEENPKTRQNVPTKPKPVQEHESKVSPTASYAEKAKQNEKSDENPLQAPYSNQDPSSGKKTILDLTKTPPNQKPKTRHNIPTKPKPVQEPESKESPTASYTEKPNQKQTFDENPSLISNSTQDSTSGKKTMPDLPKTPPNQKPKITQIIPTKPKPVQEPESKESPTASYTEKPKQKETSDENPSQVSNSNQAPSSGKKTIPDLMKTAPNQKPKTSQIIPTKPKPVQEPESKESSTASYTEKPKQKETFDENLLYISNSTQDSTSGKKTMPDLPKTPPNQKPKITQIIPTKPKPVQAPESKESPTASYTEKPKQKETSDENPSQVSNSNQDPSSGKKIMPDLPKTPPNQKPKITQIIPTKPKPVQAPESKESPTASYTEKPKQKETSDENPSQVSNSNQDPSSGKKTIPDLMKTAPNQKPKISQIIPTKPKPVQEHDSKVSPTASYTEKLKQKETSDKNPSQVSNSNQDPSSGKKTIPDLMKTAPNQKPKISQIIPTKPKPVQEHDSKVSPTASYTEKLKQKETSDKNPSQVSNSNQDLIPGKKTTPDLLITPPKQKPKTKQSIPTKPKPVQVPESKESSTASYTEKPKQKETSDENPSQVSNSNQAPSSGKKTIPDLMKSAPNQKPKISQIIPTKPKPVQEHDSKVSPTASYTEKPKQKETFDENLSYISNSTQDSTSGKKTMPDLPKTPPNQKPKITQIIPTKPKPVQEPESKESPTASYTEKPKQKETSDENPSQVSNSNQDPSSGKKTMPDLLKTAPSQKPKTSQNIPVTPKPTQKPESKESPTARYTEIPNQKETFDENLSYISNSTQDSTSGKKTIPDLTKTPPNQKPKTRQNIPTKSKTYQVPNQPRHTKPGTSFKPKPNVRPKTGPKPPETSHNFKTPKPGETPNLNAKPAPRAESNRTSKPRLPFIYRPRSMPTVRPGATPIQRPKPAVQPKLSPKTKTNPPNISWTTSDHTQTSQINTPSTSGPIKHTAEVTHSPGDREFNPSLRKTITPGPKTSNSLENGAFPHLQSLPEDSTMSPNNRIVSDLRPQTASQPASIPMTTKPNKIIRGILTSVIPSTTPGSSQSDIITNSGSDTQTEKHHKMDEIAPAFSTTPSPISHTISPPSPDFRSTTATTPGPKRPELPELPELAAEASTPSARELRVKINQVAAFFNNSLSPNGRPPNMHHKDHSEENQGGSRPDSTDGKLPTDKPPKVTMLPRDCSDHLLRGKTKSGLYLVTPDLRTSSFSVYCEMEQEGGGWTVLQRRQDGSVSFNRTWAEYQSGFGELDGGEFWLGNNIIHLLTRDREMVLRVELEDFDGLTGYAQYEQFKVASERLRYRLTVGSYSGTAGNALRFSKNYDHSNRAFTTPDRDHDRYPSGNCGAYYSSGWWFDACMSANLNGRYYDGRYKGVRNGIFWGTWHNILSEYYPTNERQSFKRVRMMIRPKGFVP